jgi:hypothetical protein
MKFFKRLGSLSFGSVSLRMLSSSRSGVILEGDSVSTTVTRPENVPVLSLTELGRGGSSAKRIAPDSARVVSVRSGSDRLDSTRLRISAEIVYGPVPVEPPQVQAQINLDDYLDTEPEVELVIENSKYNYSPFTPFDYSKSQSPESPDNSHWQPRYDNMIFFDPKENRDSPRNQTDHRRKKFLTVISANSISPHASPSTSPQKNQDPSRNEIDDTYKQSLNKMKNILEEIEKVGYSKVEILEACNYAKEFKGIMYGEDGVISKLKTNHPKSSENQIREKFEKLKLISSLFQQKCKDNQIYSGRDENSLRSQYKFADGKNNRPGLRLTYIPQEALEMFKNHDGNAVELSSTPAVAIINTSPRPATPRLI